MLAAENGGLPGGKVGGMGDVLRDLPRALAGQGHRVTVLTPAYGFLARLPGVLRQGSVSLRFGGSTEICRWLTVPSGIDGVDYQLLDHPRFSPGGTERIYHDDGSGGPFATDATKFAFFDAAAAALLSGMDVLPDVIHLHDWHTGLFLLLRQYDPAYRVLRRLRAVFSIHNLALQGIRPLRETESCLARWYPELEAPPAVLADPRYPNCINPMAVAIRLADAVSTVSPSYAREILQAPDAVSGSHGGEGLELLLAERDRQGALTGILNGCEYPARSGPRPGFATLRRLMQAVLADWIGAGSFIDAAGYLADKRLATLTKKKPVLLATSVGRVTEQKLGLLTERLGAGMVLDRLLKGPLGQGLLIVLGSGDPDYERVLQRAMAQHDNLLFLKGYSDPLADALYRAGDLFLMPSIFEPCGISQMLAMRAGQVCVAHAVGGLRDTVTAAVGFPFAGDSRARQARAFLDAVDAAVNLRVNQPEQWRSLCQRAKRARFSWEASAARYVREVYGFDAN